MTDRDKAYSKYADEITENGKKRIDNITFQTGSQSNHIKIQIERAFKAGWKDAIKASREGDCTSEPPNA